MEILEKKIKDKFVSLIGIDEVGRGPLAGPVVSCACLFIGSKVELTKICKVFAGLGVTDSKKLNSKKRREILNQLKIDYASPDWKNKQKFSVQGVTLQFAISATNSKVIDKINILQASLLSMENSYFLLKVKDNPHIWIDGNKIPMRLKEYPLVQALVKGDSRSIMIAVASIIAKEVRDELMNSYSLTYPHYGFEKHSGYPTKLHKEALKEYGPCAIHRRTFRGVSELI
jgi:ribonuclease HII